MITLDARTARPFPPIHEGRYEVDPEATGLTSPLPSGLVETVRRCGVKLLRVGIGCWLPTQDPHPDDLWQREWFLGRTLDDVDDAAYFEFTHLDRVLDVCLDLGVDVLLSIDSMPASLSRRDPPPVIPKPIEHAAPGYRFPDGIRCAPPVDPEVFAAASLRAVQHVEKRGVPVRYVELWNEPDLPFFYSGTFEDYLWTYRAFAPVLADAGYRVGGPSWSGLFAADQWRDGLCRAVAQEQLPMHFYSLHRYNDDLDLILADCRAMRATLDEHGLGDTELLLDEWGFDLRQPDVHGTVRNAAFTGAALMQLPAAGVAAQTQVLLVDPGPTRQHGLATKAGEPNPVALVLEVFERARGCRRIQTERDDRVFATVGEHGLSVLVANPDDTPLDLSIELPDSATYLVLTQASYDESGGWSAETPTNGRLVVPPQALALVTER